MSSPRERLAEMLGAVKSHGSFSARRTAPPDALRIEVRGMGPLELPVTTAQARQLCRLGRPARYGKGSETLLDRSVRDTWEIPRSRVKIDRRRWNKALLPALDRLRGDLGLPDACRLKAELHSMLVYAPGQFFVPHQDSEKADAMVGSLVVTLPSTFRGGALEVEHGGETATYRSSKEVSLVAFYADCRHQVRPVRSGYRVTLTYNLLLDGTSFVVGGEDPAPELVGAVAGCLDEHFATPSGRTRRDAPPGPPSRLVYLLDHEYTATGLSWARLKGDDAGRAAAIAAAGEKARCEVVLARADIHESWSCFEPDWRYGAGRYHRWGDDEEEEWEVEEHDGADAYVLDELVDWDVSLDHWIARPGERAEPVTTIVGDDEVCATTPSRDLRPYASEYEGYMGNYGNTMDRWYRRGAVAVWPLARAFSVRAEASPGWALGELERLARAGDVPGAREKAALLAPFWAPVVRVADQGNLLTRALRVAGALDEPALASVLLQPFRIEQLERRHARALAGLVGNYGERWAGDLLAAWFGDRQSVAAYAGQPLSAWVASLPRLCTALRDVGGSGTTTARLVVERSWSWLWHALGGRRQLDPPSRRDESLKELARPIRAVLDGAALLGASAIREAALGELCEADDLLATLLEVVRTSGVPSTSTKASGVDAIAERCEAWLAARLARPSRDADDWSVGLPGGCTCDLCATLGRFLADPAQRVLEWPIAQDRRRHVHARIDWAELPVRHQTRRSGRPYTLVLTKTDEIFKRDQRARRRDEVDLAWLRRRDWTKD